MISLKTFLAGSLLLVSAFPVPAAEKVSEVFTIAGNGSDQTSGDGGQATDAGLVGPFGVTVGPDGALYICETEGHRIRRLDRETGIISTIAGTGQPGTTGNGGPATEAQIHEPYEIRFDAAGNLFFVDRLGHCVRKIDQKTGVITMIAGTGKSGFSGDTGPATKAQLNEPHSIILDAQWGLLICDIRNHRIRRVDLKTGIITTFAGTGEREPTPDGAPISGTPLNGPRALAVESQNSWILALREGNAIYRINLLTGTFEHLAGTGQSGYAGDGGDARKATLAGPKGVAVTKDGIFFADTESHTIRRIDRRSGIISTLIGDGERGDGPDGVPTKCRLDRPHGIEVTPDGWVYVGDTNNHRVRALKIQPAP